MTPPNAAANPLSAESLSTFMASSLPRSATSQLKTAFDVVALAVHAGMIAVGFRLVGLGEDHRIEAHADANDPQALPEEWNSTSSYAFRYAHSQSAMEFLVKVNRLGSKAVVFGLAIGADKTATFDVTVKDYVSESSLPASPLSAESSLEDAARILQDIFISSGRLDDFSALLKISVIQKLAPGLHKEGYEEAGLQTESGNSNQGSRTRSPGRAPRRQDDPDQLPEPARPYPYDDPLAARPGRGRPLPEPIPGFEDEYEINRPPRGFAPGGRNPLNIGDNDLYPQGLGPNDPMRPHFGGGLPRPGFGGGGMHPTFDDPLFAGEGQGGGGEGYDPRFPPGARYDPVGPGRGPQGGPCFPGGGGGGARPPNPFGGFGSGDFI